MKTELIQNLVLIYVKAHANESTSAAEIYEMYKTAETEIRKLDSADINAHVSDPNFSF